MIEKKFTWGTKENMFVKMVSNEVFEQGIYEKFFSVDEGDIVLDVGASVGPFAYSILDKSPKHVFCFEPSFEEFITLVENTNHGPVTCINKAVSSIDGFSTGLSVFDNNSKDTEYPTVSFGRIISDYNLNTIDFLKLDCEGGEYDIFSDINIDWIKNNVKKIVGEWHLSSPILKSKFRDFRDKYLNQFERYEVYSVDLCDIKWDLWNEHFLEYYTEVLIYIDNR